MSSQLIFSINFFQKAPITYSENQTDFKKRILKDKAWKDIGHNNTESVLNNFSHTI